MNPTPTLGQKIFFNHDGLRPGWSILIFLCLVAFFLLSAQFIIGNAYHPSKGSGQSPAAILISESLSFASVFLATWLMSKTERRPNSSYGLTTTRQWTNFLIGLVSGAICLSLLVLILDKLGYLVIDTQLLSGIAIIQYAAVWLVAFLAVALLEEYLTRGYLQYTLTRAIRGLIIWAFKSEPPEAACFWTAAILLSILFSLGHLFNPGESPIGLITAGLAGLLFSLSLWRTKSLWWAIGFHASWDWAQSFLYGVADSGQIARHHLLATHAVGPTLFSGGSTGPEGSVFALPVIGLAAALLLLRKGDRRNYLKS